MLGKLEQIKDKYLAMEARMADPSVLCDPAAYSALMREYKKLTPIIDAYTAYQRAEQDVADALELIELGDAEMKQLAQEELARAKQTKEQLEQQLRLLLRPRNPNEGKNLVVEIRACAGGEEAALFAGVLYRMYCMYCAKQGFELSPVHSNPTDLGGFREITFTVKGEEAWSHFRFESGVHRVQRVPETEAQGRVHTSAATVAILPEAEEVDVEIREADIHMDTYRSSGAGGQYINKTDSAVRLTHIPTGVVVSCQTERSQLQNRLHAMEMLRSKILDAVIAKKEQEEAASRKALVGTGDRSAKIRTYNFPQNRVTDHRIGLTLYNLDKVITGDLDEIINGLQMANAQEKLGKFNA